jgi:cysteine sulfinate desulfinase/cysteine desulfurase-like protein/glyoxylase-like metal-dependent hydrolase (beta-lactamase superfamily II)/rhodanese-related sulfurtransferase
MEIYLDCNATTPVLKSAQQAAIDAMAAEFGNPSSVHSTGLRARSMLEEVREAARRVLGAPTGRVLFTSGATEGIHTAVLSALKSLRGSPANLLLYGATEHKAVPEALAHWNEILGLGLRMEAIPVGTDGKHDLRWLAEKAKHAALVCTMAANNETGVITDLHGIARALDGTSALWMVDSVQALGKLPLQLADLPIDYAPVSGHKLFAPKGVGVLYVRDGAPFTPMFTGGGQEGGQRSGTENMSGIAAFGAVLSALERGELVHTAPVLEGFRKDIVAALDEAFPDVVFNAPVDEGLPTTINFSVPGLSFRLLLDLFDSAGVRVSGGSACSASQAAPSHVLEAMGHPQWRAASAVRLSFAPNVDSQSISAACARIRACGAALRANCLAAKAGNAWVAPPELVTRFAVQGACCYLVADPASRRCVVIDPLPELTEQLANWFKCSFYTLVAILDTHTHGDHASSADSLRNAIPALQRDDSERDALGWPTGQEAIGLGRHRLERVPLPGHTKDSTGYKLYRDDSLVFTFVGDTVLPGSLGRSDFEQSAPASFAASIRKLASEAGLDALLLPGHDYDDRFACTLRAECGRQDLVADLLNGSADDEAFAVRKADLERSIAQTKYGTTSCGAFVRASCDAKRVELSRSEIEAIAATSEPIVLVDVREPFEQSLGLVPSLDLPARRQSAPLSTFVNALPQLLDRPQEHVVFYCRSGSRAAQAARALRDHGHQRAWSLEGGLARWSR